VEITDPQELKKPWAANESSEYREGLALTIKVSRCDQKKMLDNDAQESYKSLVTYMGVCKAYD